MSGRPWAAFALLAVVSCGGDSASGPGTPKAPAAVLAKLTIQLPSSSIPVGQSINASVTGVDQNGASIAVPAVTWSTGSTAIATVSNAGVVTGIATGQTTLSATSGSISAQEIITVTTIPVASVVVSPSTLGVSVGESQTLTARVLSSNGATLSDRIVTWSSSDLTKLTVTSNGVVKGIAAGAVTITATVDGKTGSAAITVAALPAETMITAIQDPLAFIARCPTTDAAYASIRQDFDLRYDGVASTVAITCTEPYTTNPAPQMSNDLLTVQTLRMAWYMNEGTRGKLPWTTLGLYDWLKSQVAGVNFHAQQGLSACCETIGGRKYVITSTKDTTSLKGYRNWEGMLGWLLLLAHEARHANGPGHVTGCPAFPLSTDPAGCDATYDLSSLGSYGIQQWLYASVAVSRLNVGFGCVNADSARKYTQSAATNANGYIDRFVTNRPVAVIAPTPYGGPCIR